MSRLARVFIAALAVLALGQAECEQLPVPPDGAQAVRNYAVLGNGWNAASAPQHELDHAVASFDVAQDFRTDSGRALVASGVGTVLKYRLGIGAWPSSSAPETTDIFQKTTGNAPDFAADIRMPKAGGGVMVHDRFGFHLVDVVTPGNRAIFQRILRESLTPLLTGPDAFTGVFLDVAGPHVPTSFAGQTPAPPGGYSREAELAGWIEVYAGLRADFPDATILLNSHSPWEAREPVDFTGLGLALGSGVGLMTESRMMTFGTVSGWADETIFDVVTMLDAGLPVVVTHSFPDDSPTLANQRYWGLATYLLAVGASPDTAYGIDGVVTADELPDFPEMRFEGLGNEVGRINVLAEGRILERNFSGGRVVAHVKVAFPAASYTVPAGMEQLVLTGGGAYPAGGTLSWQPIASGPHTLEAPASTMPPNTALILRNAP